jgi:hypothetical protein
LAEPLSESFDRDCYLWLARQERDTLPNMLARSRRFSPRWRRVEVAQDPGFKGLFGEELTEAEIQYCYLLKFRGTHRP